jgi:hypothetical protein
MVDENGYEPIPDVEQGQGGAELTPKEKYPQANNLQLELLTKLDQCIEGPKIEFEVPEVSAKDLGIESADDIKDYLQSVVIPTIITAILIGIFLLLQQWEFSRKAIDALYPYIAGTLIFLPSGLAMKDRMLSRAKKAFDTFEQGGDKVEARVDKEAERVDTTIESVQTKTHEVLEFMKPTLDMATKAEKVLKRVYKDIDIPDPTDIDRELDGAQDMVSQAFSKVKQALDWRKLLPGFTEDDLKIKLVAPIILVFFFIQMVGVYTATAYSEPESVAPLVTQYITIVVENATVFFGSTAAVVYAVNDQVEKSMGEVKRVATEQGASQVMDEIFGERLKRVKSKLLNLIKKVNVLELFMNRPEVKTAMKMANTNINVNIGVLADDMKDKAKDAAGDAKKAFGALGGDLADDMKDKAKDAAGDAKKAFGALGGFFK